jgi:argininosuccinate synthase
LTAFPDNRDENLTEAAMSAPKKVVLAYSGGLDTSIILKWLQTEYGCEVVTFTADLGQGEELEPARQKAILLGIKPENIHIVDVREEFVRDFVFPMFRANALYEGLYLLGTSIARPLISQHLVRIAAETGADAVAHGATGKGNDQVRFELCAYALNPAIKVIAPWREWDLTSRTKLIEFAEANQIPISKDKRGEAPFSVDANLLHTSSEGKALENPADEAPEYVYQRTVAPEDAPNTPEMVEITFERGDAVAINGVAMSPAAILTKLNELGGAHGVGRLDLVENRFVGMKSRGVYETPGGTILLEAHRGIEQITLDSGAGHLKDSIMPRYAELIYNGFWFSPEREMLQALIDKSQEHVTGTVRLKLYKGSVRTVARWSDHSLYSEKHVTFEEDAGAYDQKDAAGFIRLNALRLKLIATRNARVAKKG